MDRGNASQKRNLLAQSRKAERTIHHGWPGAAAPQSNAIGGFRHEFTRIYTNGSDALIREQWCAFAGHDWFDGEDHEPRHLQSTIQLSQPDPAIMRETKDRAAPVGDRSAGRSVILSMSPDQDDLNALPRSTGSSVVMRLAISMIRSPLSSHMIYQ